MATSPAAGVVCEVDSDRVSEMDASRLFVLLPRETAFFL